MMKGSDASNETAKLLRDRYSPIPRDENEKVMDAIQKLMLIARDPTLPLKSFLDETGRLIHRLFDFREIAIGMRSKNDNLFRYEVLIGFNSEAERARKKLTYTHEDMLDSKKYPNGLKITKKTEFMMVELLPYKQGEEETYNRPLMLKKERTAPDDFIEGDYIQIYFYGIKDDYLGWIELSGPKSGKIPPRSTIKWIEFIAQIIGTIVYEREFTRPSA
jgi:hypothetical protein